MRARAKCAGPRIADPQFLDRFLDAQAVIAAGGTPHERLALFGTADRRRALVAALAFKAERAAGVDLGPSPSRAIN
jgi:hypothetical protein